MPQAASVALTCGESRNSRRAKRGATTAAAAPVSSAPATPFLRQRFQPVPASARTLIGEPSRRNRCSASPRKAADQAAPGLGISAEKAAIRAAVFSRSVLTPNQRPSGKALAKQSATGANSSPCRFQFICIFPVEGGAGEQAEIHRAEIVTEAGKREFARLDGAADRRVALENADFPAFQRQMRGAGQTVVARPDKDGVELAHAPNPIPLGLKIIADAYVFV